MNISDMLSAVRSGYHPKVNPAGFLNAVLHARLQRQEDEDRLRIRDLTRARGYSLVREWTTSISMLAECDLPAPCWLGHNPTVEEWKRRGSFPLYAFGGSGDNRASLFELRATRLWRRLL